MNFSSGGSSDAALAELNIEVVSSVCPTYPDASMDESCMSLYNYLGYLIADFFVYNLFYFSRRVDYCEWNGEIEGE